MTVEQLTPLCSQHQLSITGSKHDMIARLIKAGWRAIQEERAGKLN
jgi:hypothetical protein